MFFKKRNLIVHVFNKTSLYFNTLTMFKSVMYNTWKSIIDSLLLCRHPVMYNAYFGAGSDPEFTVTPQTGELLPQGTNGTLLAIKFKPALYGKIYMAKLVIQVRFISSYFNGRSFYCTLILIGLDDYY